MNDATVPIHPAPTPGGSGGAGTFGAAAYGGAGWSQRTATHAQEMGRLWAGGVDSEWRRLKTVLLRRPGPEIVVDDVDAAQQLEPPAAGTNHLASRWPRRPSPSSARPRARSAA